MISVCCGLRAFEQKWNSLEANPFAFRNGGFRDHNSFHFFFKLLGYGS